MNFTRCRLSALTALTALLVAAQSAWAVDPFTVRDIRIEGLQRVEPGTVFVSIPVQVGDVYNDDKAAASIRALFALGLFKDVRIEVNGDVLVVVLKSAPPWPTLNLSVPKSLTKRC